MSDRDRIGAAVKEALAVGQVDILLNCAGLQRRFPAEEMSFSAWDDVQNTNLAAIFAACQAVGQHWLAQKQPGVIINVASLAAMQGGVNMVAYAASKGGVLQLTKALSNEWVGRGIRVNCVSPGYIATDINKDTRTQEKHKANFEAINARIPMGRWGEADDFKGVAVFMASKASAYMSGENLVIDGGWMAR
jgi:2-dehydro-3-deoxy-D-gluconate 5-dehydrogenase